MRYQLPSKGQQQYRTEAYRGSTDDYMDDPDVIALKESVRNYNKMIIEESKCYGRVYSTLQRVTIKGRGKRKAYSYHTNLCDADYFDVYVQDDNDRTAALRCEIETGLTQAEQRKIDGLRHEIRKTEMAARRRKG